MIAFFQDIGPVASPEAGLPQTVVYMGVLAGMALLPFLLAMITSFAKLLVVGGLLRQALGLQQTPPTIVLTGLAVILTFHVMKPVIENVVQESTREGRIDPERLLPIAIAHMAQFLDQNTGERERKMMEELRGATTAAPVSVETQAEAVVRLLTVQAPAFLLTELAEAFLIGFLLFIPFVVIDLVVGNVLLAMGMSMLTPTTVSVPIKLLVFVLADGWNLFGAALLQNYQHC